METQPFYNFLYWINQRHAIYCRKKEGLPWPWTEDKILQKYKFTNVFRELDKTTVWMRENLTNPNAHQSYPLMIYNCAVFRMFGTMEMCEAIGGWQDIYNPRHLKRIARERLDNKQKVFTGAYIITNQGKKDPKENIVVDEFLFAIWDYRQLLSDIASRGSLQQMHQNLGKLQGWGGGGFMAYELVSDLRHTPVLRDATDINTWANAGPGAKRGLNRVFGRPLKFASSKHGWNEEMKKLLLKVNALKHSYVPTLEMREIEHSLCEFDKYERVKNGEGKPRSIYQPPGQERSKWARYRARRKEKMNEEHLRSTPDLLQSKDEHS
jgi:hypothetical protein|tara:strand:+ start:7279 stop:8247 length:969 start_codon:yes stop_codon:yes gene_type:complete